METAEVIGSAEATDLFRREIGTKVNSLGDTQVVVTSYSPDIFMNLWVRNKKNGNPELASLSAAEAQQLRDALIEAYPVEPKKPEALEYRVERYSGRWRVVRDVPSTNTESISTTDSEADALKIAKALNEAEGL